MPPSIQIVSVKKVSPKQVRVFCLQIIKEVYGYDYRPDWHVDLDSLLQKNGEYSEKQNGAFFVALDNKQLVGTIGIKSLLTKTTLLKKFPRYGDGKSIGSIWRAYVDKDYRGKGIGKKLVEFAEKFSKDNGHKKIYLHTSKLNPNAVAFWQKRGYEIILEDTDPDQTIHLEKPLI